MSRSRTRLTLLGFALLSIIATFQNCAGSMRSAPGGFTSLNPERGNIGGIPNPPDTPRSSPTTPDARADGRVPPRRPLQSRRRNPCWRSLHQFYRPVIRSRSLRPTPADSPPRTRTVPRSPTTRANFTCSNCSSGDPNGSWDYIRYRKSQDGVTWTNEHVVMAASDERAVRIARLAIRASSSFKDRRRQTVLLSLLYRKHARVVLRRSEFGGIPRAEPAELRPRRNLRGANRRNWPGPTKNSWATAYGTPMDTVVGNSNDVPLSNFAALGAAPIVRRRGVDQGVTTRIRTARAAKPYSSATGNCTCGTSTIPSRR